VSSIGGHDVSALLAICAALSFGISDVAGAVATRRSSVGAAVLAIQLAGFPLLVVGALMVGGTVSMPAITLGAIVGLLGTGGFLLYMKSMAVGPIGVISPISAAVGAGVPVIWALTVVGEALTALQFAGIAAGIAAVVLVAWSPGSSLRAFGTAGPMIAFIAGCLFGLSFVALDATPPDSGLIPLVVGRTVGTIGVLAFALHASQRSRHIPTPASASPSGSAHQPIKRQRPYRAIIQGRSGIAAVWRGKTGALVTVAGCGDSLAIILFLLATRSGLLSLASLLTSLYPGVALVIARYVLKERLNRIQAVGVVFALLAMIALTI